VRTLCLAPSPSRDEINIAVCARPSTFSSPRRHTPLLGPARSRSAVVHAAAHHGPWLVPSLSPLSTLSPFWRQRASIQRLLFRPLNCKACIAPPFRIDPAVCNCGGRSKLELSGVPFFTPSCSLADGAVCIAEICCGPLPKDFSA